MKSTISGILSITPSVGFAIFALIIFYDIEGSDDYRVNLWFTLNGIALITWMGFAHHLYSNTHIPKNKKNMWTLLFLLGSVPVLPFYWWWYIRDST